APKYPITAAGRRRLEADRAEYRHGLEKIMTDWDPEDVAEFAAYLSRFNRDIERLDGRPWPRG
ncbi:MarR family transcriptional regulator, partial [Streptomyces sp. NPDC127044]